MTTCPTRCSTPFAGSAMSSGLPDRPGRTIGVKLIVYYSAYFVASVLLVLGLAYVLLSSSLERKDRQQIQWELGELLTIYGTGGVVGVRDFLNAQEAAGMSEPFSVRLFGADGATLFVWRPAQLTAVDPEYLRNAPITPADEWVLLPVAKASPLELTAVALSDGGRLEVGASTEDRKDVLRGFQRVALLTLIPVVVLGLGGGALLA